MSQENLRDQGATAASAFGSGNVKQQHARAMRRTRLRTVNFRTFRRSRPLGQDSDPINTVPVSRLFIQGLFFRFSSLVAKVWEMPVWLRQQQRQLPLSSSPSLPFLVPGCNGPLPLCPEDAS